MSLNRCKCGRTTNNGIFCTNCQKDFFIDPMRYDDEEPEEDQGEILDEPGDLPWDYPEDEWDDS